MDNIYPDNSGRAAQFDPGDPPENELADDLSPEAADRLLADIFHTPNLIADAESVEQPVDHASTSETQGQWMRHRTLTIYPSINEEAAPDLYEPGISMFIDGLHIVLSPGGALRLAQALSREAYVAGAMARGMRFYAELDRASREQFNETAEPGEEYEALDEQARRNIVHSIACGCDGTHTTVGVQTHGWFADEREHELTHKPAKNGEVEPY